MALGGGVFVGQNKVLPGAYINFVSAASADPNLSDRGIATMPMELDWGIDGEIFEVTSEDFQNKSKELFGYSYDHEKLKGLRDLFKNARTLYAYKLNSGGVKASNEFAEALYTGVIGNELRISIQKNIDIQSMFDVKTLLGTIVVDEQTVKTAKDLKQNKFVRFKAEAELTVNASAPLTSGTNGSVDGSAYQNYLNKVEAYSFNVMGAATNDNVTKELLIAFTKRMRDEAGIKFQLVLYNKAADHFGVVNVKNKAIGLGNEAKMVYWVSGALAGCPVNRSCQNKIYDGEYEPDTALTQIQLKESLKAGEFTLHKTASGIRVLEDINSKITLTEAEGELFKDNQTVRVMDQIANDIALMFNAKYLGNVQNDESGRLSLWSDIVKHHKRLNDIRAIEDFADSDVSVLKGDGKKSVVVNDAITVVNAMSKLYMTVTVA